MSPEYANAVSPQVRTIEQSLRDAHDSAAMAESLVSQLYGEVNGYNDPPSEPAPYNSGLANDADRLASRLSGLCADLDRVKSRITSPNVESIVQNTAKVGYGR